MPIPNPTDKEKTASDGQKLFVSRCVADSVMEKEFSNKNQRLAVCYSQYKKAKKNKETKSSEEEPTWEEFSNDETAIIDP